MKQWISGLAALVMFFGGAAQAQACRGPGPDFLNGPAILLLLAIGLVVVLVVAGGIGLAAGAIIGTTKERVKTGCIWGSVGGVIGGVVAEGLFWGAGLPAWSDSFGSIENLWFIPLIIGSLLGACLLAFGALMPADHNDSDDGSEGGQKHFDVEVSPKGR